MFRAPTADAYNLTVKLDSSFNLDGESPQHLRLARTNFRRTLTEDTYNRKKICLQHKSNWFNSNHPRYLGM